MIVVKMGERYHIKIVAIRFLQVISQCSGQVPPLVFRIVWVTFVAIVN